MSLTNATFLASLNIPSSSVLQKNYSEDQDIFSISTHSSSGASCVFMKESVSPPAVVLEPRSDDVGLVLDDGKLNGVGHDQNAEQDDEGVAILTMPGGRRIKLRCLKPSMGNTPTLDVRNLFAQHGVLLFDPGFYSTCSCASSITYIDGDKGLCLYRGYAVQELTQHNDYLDVCHLLLYGELPTTTAKKLFERQVKDEMLLHNRLQEFITSFVPGAHPMSILASVVSAFASFYTDPMSADHIDSFEMRELACVRLIAKLPTVVAGAYKTLIGEPLVYPRADLSYAENFLHMMFSKPIESYTVNPLHAKIIDTFLIIHADHEQNASTSTVRSAGSSLANPYTCIASGITSLWGRAHGGANEAVIKMLEEIGHPSNIPAFLEKVKSKQVRLMGFGHRIYRNYDPRAKLMRELCYRLRDTTAAANTARAQSCVPVHHSSCERNTDALETDGPNGYGFRVGLSGEVLDYKGHRSSAGGGCSAELLPDHPPPKLPASSTRTPLPSCSNPISATPAKHEACGIGPHRRQQSLGMDTVESHNPQALFDLALALEQAALTNTYFTSRKLYPNVDFYSGILMRALNIPVEMFTAMFALGRCVGWLSHWKEMVQQGELKIARPRQLYIGETMRHIAEGKTASSTRQESIGGVLRVVRTVRIISVTEIRGVGRVLPSSGAIERFSPCPSSLGKRKKKQLRVGLVKRLNLESQSMPQHPYVVEEIDEPQCGAFVERQASAFAWTAPPGYRLFRLCINGKRPRYSIYNSQRSSQENGRVTGRLAAL